MDLLCVFTKHKRAKVALFYHERVSNNPKDHKIIYVIKAAKVNGVYVIYRGVFCVYIFKMMSVYNNIYKIRKCLIKMPLNVICLKWVMLLPPFFNKVLADVWCELYCLALNSSEEFIMFLVFYVVNLFFLLLFKLLSGIFIIMKNVFYKECLIV